MKLSQNYKKNIICFEGDWSSDIRDSSSILPTLTFLRQNYGIRYIYKQCGSKESMQYYLNKWKQKKYSNYSICYFAFHGKPGKIEVGKDMVTLDELAELLQDSCEDKILYFGSCLTLNIEKEEIDKFLQKTKALCVCGFESSIHFIEGSAFDMLLIEMFQNYKDMNMMEKNIMRKYKSFVKRLKFKLIYL